MNPMTDQELAAHLRGVHGITAADTYDPDIHFDVPAICFGTMYGDGSPERADFIPALVDTEPDTLRSGLDEAAIDSVLRVRPSADNPESPLGASWMFQ